MNQAKIPAKRLNMQPRLLPKQLPAFLARLRKTDRPAIPSDTVPVRVTQKPQTPVVSETTGEEMSHRSASSHPVISADSADTEATSSTLVKKYEIGSGENRVNIRIYKEPPTKPIIVEPSREAEVKQVDEETLILRLKKDGLETPMGPSTSDHKSKRIIILDE